MRYFWAFVLILFGVAGLGANAGWWDSSMIGKLFMFWPLILVFWGVDLVFKKTKAYPYVVIVLLLLSGLFIYDVAFSPKSIIYTGQNREECCTTTTDEFIEELPTDTEEVEYTVKTGAVDFKIQDTSEKLLEGNLESNFTKADVSVTNKNKIARLTLETTSKFENYSMHMFRSFVNKLTLKLNKNLPLKLKVENGASTMNFDLSPYKLKQFIVKAGASTVKIKLGVEILDGADLELDTGASTVTVDVPKEIGVKLTNESGLTTKNLSGFNKENDNLYYSDNYNTAAKKITISFKAGASTLNINRY